MRKTGFLVLWGLAVLLASCEKEGILEGSGENVAVNISLGDVFYGGNETVTRVYHSEEETVSVALGDGLFMYAKIEKNMGAETRAGEALADGVKVRVVAYQGGTIKGTGEYTVKSGVLVSENGSGFTVEEGEYDFVAYSYNSAISPDNSGAVVTVASPNDLLWGENKNKTISVLDNEVTITMTHKFEQVAVKATMTGANITVSGVTVSPGNSADLTVETGGVAKNGVAISTAVPISTWNGLNTPTVTSDPVVIYTGTNSIYVDLGTIWIDGYDEPFTNARATFNKALTAGYSYTLAISFKKTRWAKSNIYWKSTGDNTGYLTFDTHENSHQGYQGVFFKWGSLVGVSPVGSYDDNTALYVPYDYTDDTKPTTAKWKQTTRNAVKADTDIPAVTDNWTSWEKIANTSTNIPYLNPANYAGSNYSRDNTYAIDPDRNTTAMYQSLRGDICQYLSTKTGVVSGDYRLPTSNEFGTINTNQWAASNPTVNPNADGWIKGSGSFSVNNAAGKADGTANLLVAADNNGNAVYGSAINRSMGDVVFPAAGYRRDNGGALYGVGDDGCYWSGSANSSVSGYAMYFVNSSVSSAGTTDRSYGFSVRCVQN
jgi:hypothetical protein